MMPKRTRGNALERWEIALIKAMLSLRKYNDQDILAYFTRPTRSVNHRNILEIRKEKKHKDIQAAPQEELDDFLAAWPDVDPGTGLSLRGDELLVKAREAMIAAVHLFNGAGLHFRAELFIVTIVIAWTYLLHAWFRREGIDYRDKKADGSVRKTRQGAERYWDLGVCLRHARCPVPAVAIKNLEFLLDIRHEIEHRSTTRIDDQLSAKLQACCINFNDVIKSQFGSQFGLERRLPIALQFVTFSADQRAFLKKASDLPEHIGSAMDAFQERLSDEEFNDPRFAYRSFFVPKLANHRSSADRAIEFVKGDSDGGRAVNEVFLKLVDKRRYTSSEVVRTIQAEGFPRFTMHWHTQLCRTLSAKDPAKGFGRQGDYAKTWVWFDNWLERVRAHCQEHVDRYA